MTARTCLMFWSGISANWKLQRGFQSAVLSVLALWSGFTPPI